MHACVCLYCVYVIKLFLCVCIHACVSVMHCVCGSVWVGGGYSFFLGGYPCCSKHSFTQSYDLSFWTGACANKCLIAGAGNLSGVCNQLSWVQFAVKSDFISVIPPPKVSHSFPQLLSQSEGEACKATLKQRGVKCTSLQVDLITWDCRGAEREAERERECVCVCV